MTKQEISRLLSKKKKNGTEITSALKVYWANGKKKEATPSAYQQAHQMFMR